MTLPRHRTGIYGMARIYAPATRPCSPRAGGQPPTTKRWRETLADRAGNDHRRHPGGDRAVAEGRLGQRITGPGKHLPKALVLMTERNFQSTQPGRDDPNEVARSLT